MTTTITGASAQEHARIEARLGALRIETAVEGDAYDPASEQAFRDFFATLEKPAVPFLFVTNDGKIRALWRDDDRSQIAITFVDAALVQFVILNRRPGKRHEHGRAIPGDMLGRIQEAGLGRLLRG